MNTRQIGQEMEGKACFFLEQNGLTPVARNYRRQEGEIDLIMQDGNTLVFVEVKYRRNADYGNPYEAIDRRKRMTIRKVAGMFLNEHREFASFQKRFDYLGILGNTTNWIKDAF